MSEIWALESELKINSESKHSIEFFETEKQAKAKKHEILVLATQSVDDAASNPNNYYKFEIEIYEVHNRVIREFKSRHRQNSVSSELV